MINYTAKIDRAKTYKIDKTKRNILIIGKAAMSNKVNIILNPITPNTAKMIYGECDLSKAYEEAYNITNDANIYTVNCQFYTDFIELIDTLVQYDFDFIVPIDIYLNDTFLNPITNKTTSLAMYYLNRLGYTQNRTTLIMTSNPSHLYDDIDEYLSDMKKVYKKFKERDPETLNKYGNNLVFVLNNLFESEFSNVILAAALSVCNFKSYPKNIKYQTYFDIDYSDVDDIPEICYYKYHPSTNDSSIEQLNNSYATNNIYKRVLIDLLIKYVTRQLDLTEFNGLLFNPYVKVRIDTKVDKIMNQMLADEVYTEFKINQIAFVKTGLGVGNIIVDVSITPYSLLETINIIMEL